MVRVRVEGYGIDGDDFVINELEIRTQRVSNSAVSQIQNFGDLQHLSTQRRRLLGRDVDVGAGDVHL